MLGWWRRRRERRYARDLETLRARFDRFCHLLEGNNRVLELLADAAEKSGGDYLFDRRYLESLVDELERAASGVVLDLNAMTGGRHFALVAAFERVRKEVRDLLATGGSVESELVLPLEGVDLDLATVVGEKLATVGELGRRLGLPVPAGFVLSAAACRRQFERCGIEQEIASHARAIAEPTADGLDVAATALTDLVRRTPLDRRVARALRREVGRRRRSGWMYAVRSSAVGEDGSHSFAGQHATLLNVRPSDVADAYREVLASLFSSEALRYRVEKGLPIEGALMAVGFLAMVPARASGVIHTTDPAAPERDAMVVAAAYGLGPTVAHGGSSADRFELSREPLPSVLARRVALKETAVEPQAGGGTRLVPVPEQRRGEPCVTDEELTGIGRLALRVERFVGRHQEIEWAVTPDGGPVILQARALRIPPGQREARVDPEHLGRVLAQRAVLLHGEGVIACRGLGAGKVVVIDSRVDPRDFPVGGVLVARSASPRHAVVLPLASAVITRLGTPAGHLAAVAREFRVPMLVDVGSAVEALRPDMEVTVDAEENVVYEGVVKELVRFHLSRPPQGTEEEQSRLLRQTLRRIAPLNLSNPDSQEFQARGCRTYHDVIRFAHEMAVRDLREMPSLSARKRRRFVRRLKLGVPLDLDLVDVGGGLAPGSHGSCVEPEAVQCAPLNAVLRGLAAPGGWRTEPTDMDVGSLLASATRVSDATIADTGTERSNLAVISGDYLSLHLFLGYHFNMVDCQLSEAASYIDFRFHGGATDVTRRSRRARLLAMILEEYDFAVETKGDLVIGRLRSRETDPVNERLEMIGRLIGYSRQLDVLLRDEETVFERLREFLGRPRTALDRPAHGEQAQDR